MGGLDEILGGGVPEFSFNIIAGAPGCGKTTLAHQIVFANGTPKSPALYFTILGEPALKMLRYQQQFSFFDESKLGKAVRFINLSDLAMEQDLNAVLEEIIKQVTAANAGVVVVDSFRTLARKAGGAVDAVEVQSFIHRLSQFLTGWEATTFLIGEYAADEIRDNSLFTLVDGIFWLSQVSERNSVVRKLQIMKLRGQATVPGLHTVRITDDGVQAFSRTLGLIGSKTIPSPRRRLSVGIPELDKMLGGGILEGDSAPGGRTLGHRQIGIGDAIHRRGTAPWGTRDHGDLRGAPGRLHPAGGRLRPESERRGAQGTPRNPLPSSARPVGR